MVISFRHLKFGLSFPKKVEVLVWGLPSAHLLVESAKKAKPDCTYFIFDTGFNLNLWVAFLGLWIKITKRKNGFESYSEAVYLLYRPKIAITFVDNDWRFWSWSGRHRDVETFVVQNGRRFFFGDLFGLIPKSTYYQVDHLFCFSESVGREYSKVGNFGSIYPVGSYKNNLVPVVDRPKEGVLWVSSFEPGLPNDVVMQIKNGPVLYDLYHSPDVLALQLTARACEKLGIKFSVSLRKEPSDSAYDAELSWFADKLAGIPYEILEKEDTFSSYILVDKSRLVVTCDGTLGYEALSRRARAVFLPFRSKLLGHPPVTSDGQSG